MESIKTSIASLLIALGTPTFADESSALGLFEQLRYTEARPQLEAALRTDPGNAALAHALATVQYDVGEIDSAWSTLQPALRTPNTDAALLAGQILTARRDYADAADWYRKARDLATTDAQRRRATLALSHALIRSGDSAGLERLAASTQTKAADDVAARFLSGMQAQRQRGPQRAIRAEVGYRIEHDSNVPSAPQNLFIPAGADRKSDLRHVLFGDIIGRHDFGNGWTAFGEAHLNRGWHDELDELDYLDTTLVASLGWSGEGIGFRMPLEYHRLDVDSDRFSSTWSISPGVVFQPAKRTRAFAFVRLEDRNFDDAPSPSEDRSGDATIFGATLQWETTDGRTGLRAIAEYGDDDADGRNWRRDWWRLYLRLDRRFSKQFLVAGGAEYIDYSYDRVHDTFFVTRDDELLSFFVAASYEFAPGWSANFSAVHLDNSSNIELYDFDRHVFSAGVSWHY